MIKASGIKKRYGSISVLNGIDIHIDKNEIVAITGDSGAGKSTLLHILGTLDKADEGTVVFDQTEIAGLKPRAMARFRNARMGFVFQFHHLLPEFSALENVMLPSLIAEDSKSDARKKAEEILVSLGLKDRLDNKPSQLSGGEQQRVSVARALVNRPEVVFADEPTGNLDSRNALELHELFMELRNRYNSSFVIVTHNPELAKLSDRCLHMQDGLLKETAF